MMTAEANLWVLINETTGPTSGGTKLTNDDLQVIADVITEQMNADYSPLCGGQPTLVRVGSGINDVNLAAGEKPYYFQDSLPDAPGASAYHVPGAAYCAVSTCEDVFGPRGVSVDTSHEILEDAGNPGCNASVDDGQGQEHELEECDAVEVQTYQKKHEKTGTAVSVSNFLLPAWRIPGNRGPFTYMAKANLPGYVEPAGPFQTAPGNGGNYQLIFPSDTSQIHDVFAKKTGVNPAQFLAGKPRKPAKFFHFTSRASRILANKKRKHAPEVT